MLEEALKRGDASGSGQLSKDVGWRRWSAREVQQRELKIEEERPRSLDYGALLSKSTSSLPSNGNSTQSASPTHQPSSSSTSPSTTPLTSPSIIPVSPTPIPESRFFRGFRFTGGTVSGTSTPTGRSQSPAKPGPQGNVNGAGSTTHTSTLTSPSLPSLVPKKLEADKEKDHECEREKERQKEREKRIEELSKELENEKKARMKASNEKATLEAEIESLSQALFEEVRPFVLF